MERKQSIYNALYDLKQHVRSLNDIKSSLIIPNEPSPSLSPLIDLTEKVDYLNETIDYLVEEIQEITIPTLRERILTSL